MILPALIFLALGATSFAQRPSSISICDFYTPHILGKNTAANQQLLMTLLVNTFVIGNYTTPNVGIPVQGIAGPAKYNGTEVALLPLFTGELNSTNLGGDHGGSKLFLDNGGAEPLAKNMSSNGDTSSAQYNLLTHIYQYFGTLLGCSLQGDPAFPKYKGRTSMYEVHRFMNLDVYQMGFFIQQVQDSAMSLGIESSDAVILGNALNKSFNYRCSPPAIIANDTSTTRPELHSVCIADNCPLDPGKDCAAYPLNGRALVPVNITANPNATDGDGAATSTGASSPTSTSSGGNTLVYGELWEWVFLIAFGVALPNLDVRV